DFHVTGVQTCALPIYRHDRLAFLKASHAKAVARGYHLGVKLVRGAYMEKERDRAEDRGYPSPIHVDKAAVDRDYDDALRYCAKRSEERRVGKSDKCRW